MKTPSRSFLSSVLDWLTRLFGGMAQPPPTPSPAPPSDIGVLAPLRPRVLLVIFNPVVDAATGKKLIQTLDFNDPDQLVAGYIQDIQACSQGLVNYQIVERVEANEIPVKADGFQYQAQEYVNLYRAGGGFHTPDLVDYESIIVHFNLLQRVASDEFDEVWMFGAPYFGFWESTMGGAGAFFTNSVPLPNTEQCPRRFVIMGFSYERGVGEMLEDLGHRAESTLRQVYRTKSGDTNLFDRYARYDKVAPQQANVGLLHFAPNSVRDYDWGNMTPVRACCDDWFQFPYLPDPPNYRTVTANDWGNGDIRAHHRWWLEHLPKVAGTTNGIANNWWRYIINVNDPIFEVRH